MYVQILDKKDAEYLVYSNTQDAIVDWENPFDTKYEIVSIFYEARLLIEPDKIKYYKVLKYPISSGLW